MHFSKPFFFYCPINTKRSLFSCDGYFKVLNVVSQKAVSPTCLVSESQKVEHFILSRSFYSILILFRRQQILLVLWALRVWESVCLKRGSKASMESWMPPSPGLGHCPRWGDLKVSDAERGEGVSWEYTERRMRKLRLHCSFIHSAGGQGCSPPLTSQRSQVLRNSPIHTFPLNEAGDVLWESWSWKSQRERDSVPGV